MTRERNEIILHLTNDERAHALARPSLHRLSMTDARCVNGRRISFPVYNPVLMNGHIAFNLHGDAGAMGAPPASATISQIAIRECSISIRRIHAQC